MGPELQGSIFREILADLQLLIKNTGINKANHPFFAEPN
jgi:hypothetical protein